MEKNISGVLAAYFCGTGGDVQNLLNLVYLGKISKKHQLMLDDLNLSSDSS